MAPRSHEAFMNSFPPELVIQGNRGYQWSQLCLDWNNFHSEYAVPSLQKSMYQFKADSDIASEPMQQLSFSLQVCLELPFDF